MGLAALAGPATIAAAKPLTYTVVVTNAGSYLGRNVAVAVTLPAGVTGVGCQAALGSCARSGNQVTANWVTLAVGAPQTATITLHAPAIPGLFTTTATLRSSNDQSANNNAALLPLTVLPATDLALALGAQPDPVLAGAPLTYTLQLTNLGPQPADLAVITGTLAITGTAMHCTVAPLGDCLVAGRQLTVTVADLLPNSSVRATLVMTTPALTSIFTMTAGVAHRDDYDLANNRAAVYPSVRQFLPVQVISPLPQSRNVAPQAGVIIDLPFALAVSTITPQTFQVYGVQGGLYDGVVTYDPPTRRLTFTPSRPYLWGDVVRVTVSSGLKSVAGDPVAPYQWQFTVGSAQSNCPVHFADSHSNIPVVDAASSALGDEDGDGDLDLLLIGNGAGGQPLTLLYHNDGGTFSAVATTLPAVTRGAVAWGDSDHDGDLDLLLSGELASGSPVARLYRNDGGGQFTDLNLGLPPLRNSAVAWGDYDNDGALDFVISGNAGSPNWETTQLYRNGGNHHFTLVNAGLLEVANGALAWGDYDTDGDLDLLVMGTISAQYTAGVQLYRNDQDLAGTPHFTPVVTTIPALFDSTVVWGDYEGDGDLDLLVEGRPTLATQTIQVLRQDGPAVGPAPTFITVATLASSINLTADWGDVDNDGDLDVVTTAGPGDRMRVYRYAGQNGDGSANFAVDDLAPAPYLAGAANGFNRFGDFNGDGTLDIWFSSRTTGGIYANSGCAQLTLTPTSPLPSAPASAGITHTLTIANQGAQAAQPAIVTMAWPAAVTDLACVSGAAVNWTVQGNRVTATYANLGVHAQTTLTVTFTAPPLTGRYHYTASVTTSAGAWVVAEPLSRTFTVRNGISVTAIMPPAQALAVAPTTTLILTFSQPLDLRTITSRTVTVLGELGGRYPGTYRQGTTPAQLTFTPQRPLLMGDTVRVVVSPAVRGVGVGAPPPAQWQFTVGSDDSRCATALVDSGLRLPGLPIGDAAAWVDYDVDGDLDLLLTGSDTNYQAHSYLYANQGGNLVAQATVGLPALSYGDLAWGDYDGDGDPDLLFSGEINGNRGAALYRNDGPDSAAPTAWRFTDLALGFPALSVGATAWGDYDNDGDLDLLLTGVANSVPRALLYRNDRAANGSHAFTLIITALTGRLYSDAAWADYDNDGDLDLALIGSELINTSVDVTTIYRNDGLGATATKWHFTDIGAGLPGLSLGGIAWGDYDRDGDLDLAMNGQFYSGSAQRRSYLYRNDGGLFNPAATLVGRQSGGVSWGDVDNDGDLDLLNHGSALSDIAYGYLYRNQSSGGTTTFQQINLGQPNAFTSQTLWGDYNNDGALDLLVAGEVPGAATLLYHNRGCADLTATIATAPTPIQPGARFTQTITLHNAGPQAAVALQAVDTLPAHNGVVGCVTAPGLSCQLTPAVGAAQSATLTSATLAAGQAITMTLIMTAPSNRFVLANRVQVSAVNENDATNNSSETTSAVDIADLAVSAQVTPTLVTVGAPLTYTVTITNLGLQPLAQLQVDQRLPQVEGTPHCVAPGATACTVNRGVITTTYSNLAAGAVTTLTLTLPAPDRLGSFVNQVDASAANDADPTNNTATATVTIASNAALTLTNFAAPAWVGAELPFTYTIGARNLGPHIARNVQIKTQLPLTMTATTCQAVADAGGVGSCAINGHLLLATYGAVAPQGVLTVTVIAAAGRYGTISSTVTLTATNTVDGQAAPALTRVTTVRPANDLALTVQATPMQLLAGDPLTYTLTVHNHGPLTATGSILQATLPPGFTNQHCQITAPNRCELLGDLVEVTLAPLAEDATTTITLTMTTPDRTDQLPLHAWVEHPLDYAAANNVATVNPTVVRYTHAELLAPAALDFAVPNPALPLDLVAPTAPLVLRFADDLDLTTVTTQTVVVQGTLGGHYTGDFAYNRANRRLTFTPARPFIWGESLQVTVARTVQSTARDPLLPTQWPLRVGEISTAQCAQHFTDIAAGLPVAQSAKAQWVDYDLDGDLDLFHLAQVDGQWRTELYTNAAGTFVPNGATTFPAFADGAAAWGDHDNDGDPDLLINGALNGTTSLTRVYRNDGDGRFVDINAGLIGTQGGDLAWGDYDNDGDLDVVATGFSYVAGYSGPRTDLYRNNGDSTFTRLNPGLLALTGSMVAWADYDGDGDVDLLLSGQTDSFPAVRHTLLYRNDGLQNQPAGTGAPIFTLINSGLPGLSRGELAWGDYDNDGDPDLLLQGDINSSTGATYLYRNDFVDDESATNGSAPLFAAVTTLNNLHNGSLAWGDYDNDGDLDLVSSGGSNSGSYFALYQNNGTATPQFQVVPLDLPGVTRGVAAWGDYDADGALDLLLSGWANSGGITRIYRNSGCAHLRLTEDNRIDAILAGDPIGYRLLLHNAGPQAALGVTLTNTLPLVAFDIGCQVAAGSCQVNDNQIEIAYDQLEAGATSPITLTWAAPAQSGLFTNTALVASTNLSDSLATSVQRSFNVINLLQVTDTVPSAEAMTIAPTTTLAFSFTYGLDRTSVTSQTVVVRGSLGGVYAGNFGFAEIVPTLRFTPTRPFLSGETVTVNLSRGVRSEGYGVLAPRQWQFTTGQPVAGCTPTLRLAATLPPAFDGALAWADYDLDGDLDLLVTGGDAGIAKSALYRNDGGTFVEQTGANFQPVTSGAAAWGDYDNDGDPDLLLTGSQGGSDYVTRLYRNQGAGTFSDTNSPLTSVADGAVAWGDYDNDGDLDLVLSGHTYANVGASVITQLYRNDLRNEP